MIAAILLALQLDVAKICARYESYTPPGADGDVVDCDLEQFCFGTLAEKHANGDGVKRDLDAAEYFLCQAGSEMAVAEHEGMLEHLQQMRAGETDEPLDFCDHVTSGYGSAYCAQMQYDREMPKLDERLGKIRKNAGFDPLKQRAQVFLEAESERIGYESRHGTGYSAIVLHFDIWTRRGFVETLERFASKRAPAATEAQAKKADADLNAAYRKVMNGIEDDEEEDEIDPKTLLRDAQRAWIAYRDAFAGYYVERWRGAAVPDALRREIVTQLTLARTKELLQP